MNKNETRLAYHLIRDIDTADLTPAHYNFQTPFDLKNYCHINNLNPSNVNPDDDKALQDIQSTLETNETLYVTHFLSNE